MQTAPALHRTSLRLFLLLIVIALPLATANLEAAAPSRVACGLCEQPDRFVRLQVSPSKIRQNSDSGFTHPFRLQSEEWTLVLQRVRVQKRDRGWFPFAAPQDSATQAFSADEVAYLSATLPRAFAQAQPEEWVVFGLSRPTTPEVAGITEITTGAWFVRGASLHLVLANYREGVTMPGIRDLLREDPLHMVAAPRYEFIPGSHENVWQENTGLGAFLFPDLPELTLAYQALVLEEPERPIAPLSGSGSVNLPTPTPTTPRSPEERLQMLKRLKEQGLITEEDYQTKKKQVLDEF
ncbi:MAG: SHOCT domain-containing protein [Nitrospira sp.]|nr:SHOCT domain-containing protein [Nitrospira sp.]